MTVEELRHVASNTNKDYEVIVSTKYANIEVGNVWASLVGKALIIEI